MENEKIVIKTEGESAACICAGCPSYNDCAKEKNELLFCCAEIGLTACNGKTCDYKRNGCICGSCPVHEDHGLDSGYYCLHEQ